MLPYERQLEEKEAQVRDALERIGGFESPPVEPIVPAVEQLRYRNKLEYSFGEDEDGELVLGFHRPGRCRPDRRRRGGHPRLRARRRGARGGQGVVPRGGPVRLGPRDRRPALLRNLVVREGRRTGQVQARVVTSPGSEFRVDELAAATPGRLVPLDARRGRGRDHARRRDAGRIKGQAHLEEELSGLRFRISPDAFFQTNTEMAERLYGAAAELAGADRPRAGARPVLRHRHDRARCSRSTPAEVWGVEIVEEAVADAIENAQLNGIDNARFFAGDVRLVMRAAARAVGQPDVVVVDPPRAGLSQKVVRRVIEAEAQRIVYVSCNPTTLAPNARQLVDDGGYELKTRAAGRHVPADAAHRVRGAARRAAPALASSSSRSPRPRARVQRNGPPVSSEALISSSVSFVPHSAQRALDDRIDA